MAKDLPGKLPPGSRRQAITEAMTALCFRTKWTVGQCHCKVCALGSKEDRGDGDSVDGEGLEHVPDTFAYWRRVLMFLPAQGTECHS